MNTFTTDDESFRQGYQAGYSASEDEKCIQLELLLNLRAELDARPTHELLDRWIHACSERDATIQNLHQELESARQELALVRQQQCQNRQALLHLQQRLEQTTKNANE